MPYQVLLIEDEPDLAEPLVFTLKREGYAVAWARGGEEALRALNSIPGPDLIIADLGLPDIDGLEVIARARAGGFEGGVMILTSRDSEVDRVVGLDIGADDYQVKPFALAEFSARVRALLRRASSGPSKGDSPGRVQVDRASRRVTTGDVEIVLSNKEYDVLVELLASAGRVVPRVQLMDNVWGPSWFGSPKALDVTVGRLRQKLRDAGVTDDIAAVRGVGFRLDQQT